MPPTVLVTNDDGPPDSLESPYVYGLYKQLKSIGWDIKVVLPSSQNSWISSAYKIKEVTTGRYYYPREPDGQGELADSSRPLKEGEVDEWILLSGTPATCSNIALHNLYPGQIDLVISGPNLGRNTSTAYSLHSGTIGAALSASTAKHRSIAISYGTLVDFPTSNSVLDPAHILGVKIIQHLWNTWTKDSLGGVRDGEVDLYTVNIPLVENLLTQEGLKVYWTTLWRNSYHRLFQEVSGPKGEVEVGSYGGPDAQPVTGSEVKTVNPEDASRVLKFKWSPEDIEPDLKDVPVGSDTWAILQGHVCVTPMRAGYGEATITELGILEGKEEGRLWRNVL